MVLEINSKNLHMKRVKKINKYFSSLPPLTPGSIQSFFFSLFKFNIMVITYYCAYLRKIAWPQVNRSEAKENVVCVNLSYHLFPNVIQVRH